MLSSLRKKSKKYANQRKHHSSKYCMKSNYPQDNIIHSQIFILLLMLSFSMKYATCVNAQAHILSTIPP